jgi:hypothetical protein
MADRQERYIPAAVRASIAGDTAHGFNLNLSEPFVAPLYVLQALRSCDRFRTLDEHAQVWLMQGTTKARRALPERLFSLCAS